MLARPVTSLLQLARAMPWQGLARPLQPKQSAHPLDKSATDFQSREQTPRKGPLRGLRQFAGSIQKSLKPSLHTIDESIIDFLLGHKNPQPNPLKRPSLAEVVGDMAFHRTPSTPWKTKDPLMNVFRLIDALFNVFSEHPDFNTEHTIEKSLRLYLQQDPIESELVTVQTDTGQTIKLEVFDSMPQAQYQTNQPLTFVFFPGMTSKTETLFAPHMRAIIEAARDESLPVRLLAFNMPAHGRSDTPLTSSFSYSFNDVSNLLIQAMKKRGVSDCVVVCLSAGYMVPMQLINNSREHPSMSHMIAQSTATGQPGMLLGSIAMQPFQKLLEKLEKHFHIDPRFAFLLLLSFCGREAPRNLINDCLEQLENKERMKAWFKMFGEVNAYRKAGIQMRRNGPVNPSMLSFHAAGTKDVATPFASALLHSKLLKKAGFEETFLTATGGRHVSFDDSFAIVYELLKSIVREEARQQNHSK
jgi:hypothetical protein